jgi:predicted transcriptional regulator
MSLQEELLTADFSMIFTIFSHVQATIRNQGQEDMRIYLTDESYFWVTEENSGNYWSFIYENISSENKEQVFDIVRSYFLGVATNLVSTVCRDMARAKLDEAEMSALLLLLFTSPSSLLVLNDSTRALLREWKNATLEGVAEHIERTGRNIDERLATIVSLLSSFQVMSLVQGGAKKASNSFRTNFFCSPKGIFENE